MSKELNELLIKVYNRYKDNNLNESPVPLEAIREYLILEGVIFNEEKEREK